MLVLQKETNPLPYYMIERDKSLQRPKVTNKGNVAKSSRHGAPPGTAHWEDKTITLGGPHHVVEETAGVTKISGKYHPPVLEVLPARDKNRPCSKVATNDAPTPPLPYDTQNRQQEF